MPGRLALFLEVYYTTHTDLMVRLNHIESLVFRENKAMPFPCLRTVRRSPYETLVTLIH